MNIEHKIVHVIDIVEIRPSVFDGQLEVVIDWKLERDDGTVAGGGRRIVRAGDGVNLGYTFELTGVYPTTKVDPWWKRIWK